MRMCCDHPMKSADCATGSLGRRSDSERADCAVCGRPGRGGWVVMLCVSCRLLQSCVWRASLSLATRGAANSRRAWGLLGWLKIHM
jgi:hypothetical protein